MILYMQFLLHIYAYHLIKGDMRYTFNVSNTYLKSTELLIVAIIVFKHFKKVL